ncbi:MAG: type IV toxin-antitoxin system AbiEi family antitoxin [Thermodesulfobacteriota bacterium]|nr:type IV toxin-antitoxin system AbiEi family antitoxin [Thermodesulfobacteriota bacterium]
MSEKDALLKVANLLRDWLRVADRDIRVHTNTSDSSIDGYISVGDYDFGVEIKATGHAAQVSSAIQALKRLDLLSEKNARPLVVVPFMGEVGRKLCKEASISWIDLSGNADVAASGLRILMDGRPNRFKTPGRPSNPFAPKSARIARWLLIHADRAMSQRQLALETDMDEGFTSRIVSRLQEEGLVARKSDGTIRVPDPNLLLDAWQETYDFRKNQILKGHVAERSSNEMQRNLSNILTKNHVHHAATGLGAAWLYTKFSGFRIVTFYLESFPTADLIKEIGFREGARGSNAWIVIPKDKGVFQGSRLVEGLHCVHPVQAYLDLSGHPERAKEAAEYIRHELLTWDKNA